ncbi:hypothetical protein GBF38_014832 [Nibea albiflora]|uniref:Uncharacterized protein n=1 Tax=Nibea albiflora TaxID=240163 RepID=A0ACB7EJN4_NIBAL|nr:hypothetical protein GBF38_014832 [Nibea albiflora]
MALLQPMLMMWASLLLTAAQHHCDPETQYTSPASNECCKLCEPDLNFQAPVNMRTKQKKDCQCKEGFHCSTAECITCVPHKTCGPGYGAQSKDVAMDNSKFNTEQKHLTASVVSSVVKGCVESCVGEHEPLADTKLVTTPTGEEESTMPEPLSQEEGFGRTPEENEDELTSQETSTDVLLTDKGNYVTQENGKTEILSRQESQTPAYSA